VRALGSISANIAEGYARKSPRDRIRYYEYALGSVEESRAWFHVAQRAIPPKTLSSRADQLTSLVGVRSSFLV
jgi:four helix bundle protein